MLKKRIQSFQYAIAGIRDLFKTEPNVIIHTLATIIAIGLGYYFCLSATEWCFIVFSITLVFCAEALNTALEYLTNLASPNYHELARKTKDVAAGAVLFAALGAAIIGLIIFLPKIILFFKG